MPVKRTSRIPQVREGIKRGADVGARKAAEEIVERARARAPVKTGHLRDSIKSVQLDQGRAGAVVEAPYAPHVEFGTTRTPAKPFLFPAVEDVRRKLVSIVSKTIKDDLK